MPSWGEEVEREVAELELNRFKDACKETAEWASLLLGMPADLSWYHEPPRSGVAVHLTKDTSSTSVMALHFVAAGVDFWLMTHAEPELALAALRQMVVNQAAEPQTS